MRTDTPTPPLSAVGTKTPFPSADFPDAARKSPGRSANVVRTLPGGEACPPNSFLDVSPHSSTDDQDGDAGHGHEARQGREAQTGDNGACGVATVTKEAVDA